MLRLRSLVGLDISGDVASVAQVRRQHGGEVKVLRSGSAPIKRQPGAGPEEARAALVAAIKAAVSAAGVPRRRVAVNIPGEPVECSVRTFPEMSVREMEAVIKREGRELFGESVCWDYIELPGKPDGQRVVLTAFAPGEAVADCVSVLKEAGLGVKAVCVSHLSLLSMLESSDGLEGSAALVHFGTQAVSVVVLDAGTPALVRRIQLDGQSEASPEFVAEEINRTFLYFKQQCRGKRVVKVFQWGAPPPVLERLRRDTDAVVNDLEATREPEPGEAATAFGPVAAGLAASGARDDALNLLPDDLKERRTRRAQLAVMSMVALSVTSTYFACYAALSVAQRMYEQSLQAHQAQLQTLLPVRRLHSEIQATKARLRERQELHSSLVQESVPWSYLLWDLGRTLPREVTLTELTASKEKRETATLWSIRISGLLSGGGERRSASLKELLTNLQQCGMFSAVKLEPLFEREAERAMGFSVRCEMKPPRDWLL